MDWFPRQSAWDHQQALNARRRALAQDSIGKITALANALSATQSNIIQGQAELAAKVALSRVTGKKA